ncbi:hypothetical protein [Deinococcus altitudinis]|uniref:hypothetical protein n=1 Tax=Deinococcus altitudinis TaxID=468914 RepID=UPI003892B75C
MKTYIPATEADRRTALARIEARRAALLLELEELEAMQEGHRAALAGRPMLAQVEALPFEQVRLTLADGHAVTLDLEALPAVMLCPLPSGALLLEDWQDSAAPAYHVPVHLGASIRAALHLRRMGA